jgi:hypothetical protein
VLRGIERVALLTPVGWKTPVVASRERAHRRQITRGARMRVFMRGRRRSARERPHAKRELRSGEGWVEPVERQGGMSQGQKGMIFNRPVLQQPEPGLDGYCRGGRLESGDEVAHRAASRPGRRPLVAGLLRLPRRLLQPPVARRPCVAAVPAAICRRRGRRPRQRDGPPLVDRHEHAEPHKREAQDEPSETPGAHRGSVSRVTPGGVVNMGVVRGPRRLTRPT